MNLNIINPETIPSKSKWLAALAAYCIVVANLLWSFGSEAPIFTNVNWENGVNTITVSNVYRFWVAFISYVVIIYLVVNAFNGHPRATTFWVCLAASTFMFIYTFFGLCVLAYVLYPFVKKWFSAKFVQAVKSATAPESGTMPPNE
jgi:hypothetical protein